MGGPPFIGLTGGIGAGKTEALEAFGRLGAATLSTDALAHELLESPEIRSRLLERWGPEVSAGESIDRNRVAEVVFNSPDDLDWLEAQLHPLVRERVKDWREQLDETTPVAVVEVPLLHESGMAGMFDAVVCVTADDATREERARARGLDGLEGRSARQLSQEEKAAASTHVLANDGKLAELEAAVSELLPALQVLAE